MLEFKNINDYKNQISKYKTITTILSIIRLILSFVVVVLIVLLFSLQEYVLYSILSSIFFILTILFIVLTNPVYNHYNHLKNILKAYDNHLNRRRLDLHKFYDTGADFLVKDDYKLYDLDIFGKDSIYQYLNVSKTYEGRKNLANVLINGNDNKDKSSILVSKLAQNEDVIKLEADLYDFNKEAKSASSDDLNSIVLVDEHINYLSYLPLISYIATIAMLVIIPVLGISWLYILIPLLFNVLLSKFFIHSDIFNLNSSLYSDIISNDLKIVSDFNKLDIDDEYYNELKEELNNDVSKAIKLKKMYSILSTRHNIIFNILFNTIFIIDFMIIMIYKNYHKKLISADKLFKNIGVIEGLMSLSNVGIDNAVYTVPEKGDEYKFDNLYHPLVKACIPNDLEFNGGIILTGSNMSGKTTFMRTIGVNHILARAGGVVLAKSFTYPDYKILTSLRTNDLLSEGISTFYAEILRMKKINEALKKEKIVILIDEIFKGTNREERLKAAEFLVSKFNSNKAIFIISTHDYELCDLNDITNYHFEESYVDDKISFDYKIKVGKSTSKNALYLLKLADII